jgi:hypothetical protein
MAKATTRERDGPKKKKKKKKSWRRKLDGRKEVGGLKLQHGQKLFLHEGLVLPIHSTRAGRKGDDRAELHEIQVVCGGGQGKGGIGSLGMS